MHHIFVNTPEGGSIPLEVDDRTLVSSISSMLYPNSDARLWMSSQMLESGRELRDYNIKSGTTLSISFPLKGGAKAGKTSKGKDKAKGEGEDAGYSELLDKKKRQEEMDLLRKQQMETRKQLLQKMELESKFTKTNQMHVQSRWRRTMRTGKLESLRKEIEILSQNHERDIDRKDAWIVLLDRDLEEAEEQYQMSLRSHLQNLDKLINIQDARLVELEKQFEGELYLLENEFKAEFDAIKKQHARECKSLLDIMSTVEALEMEREAESKQEHEQLKEEIRNKNEEDTHVLRVTLEANIDDLENHFESAHLNYLQNTDQRTQEFKKLTSIDKNSSKESAVKARKIARIESKIAHWRTKLSQNKKECEERNNALKGEKDIINNHFQDLKNRMNKFRNGQSARLNLLTQNARECKNILEERIKMAERILTLGELSRKLETEREKIVPFYTSAHGEMESESKGEGNEIEKEEVDLALGSGKEGEMIYPHQSFGILYPGERKSVPEYAYLDRFMKKCNKAILDKVAITKEKERLMQENQDLQSILKQYLDGICVNEDVLKSNNSLLVVNGKINLNIAPPKHGSHMVIEANHMVNTKRAM